MRRVAGVAAAIALGVWPALAAAQAPSVSFVSPRDGATVTGPEVEVRLSVKGFRLVAAGTPVRAGEGHAHILIDREARPGELLPTGQPDVIHLGSPPFDTRKVTLQPGRHTLQAVLADSSHRALDPLVASKITITVAAPGAPPRRPAAAGDGSLAGGGPGLGTVAALALGGLGAGGLWARRR